MPHADLTLRAAEARDLETLYRIDQACYPPGIAYSRGTIRWFLRLPGAECAVAEVRGEIAGFIITEHQGGFAHIITLDVLEAHRRHGIGSALLQHAEQSLADHGVASVNLETATDNHPAVAFWQKHGYRTREVLKRYYLDRIDALRMTKSLHVTSRRPAQGRARAAASSLRREEP